MGLILVGLRAVTTPLRAATNETETSGKLGKIHVLIAGRNLGSCGPQEVVTVGFCWAENWELVAGRNKSVAGRNKSVAGRNELSQSRFCVELKLHSVLRAAMGLIAGRNGVLKMLFCV